MKTNNFRIPVVTERKVTADELYLQALTAKHECIIGYVNAGCKSIFIPFQDCKKSLTKQSSITRSLHGRRAIEQTKAKRYSV